MTVPLMEQIWDNPCPYDKREKLYKESNINKNA